MTNIEFTARTSLRLAVLTALGAPEGAEVFTWATASAALSRAQGALWIVTDIEPSPEDWESVCLLLELAGYDNGTDGPWPTDPGEGTEVMGTLAWSLGVGVPVS